MTDRGRYQAAHHPITRDDRTEGRTAGAGKVFKGQRARLLVEVLVDGVGNPGRLSGVRVR